MTAIAPPPTQRPTSSAHGMVEAARLSTVVQWAIGAVALALGVLAAFGFGGPNWTGGAIVAAVCYFAATTAAAVAVEGSRRATDRVAGMFVTGCFLAILVPLVSVLWTVVERGSARFDEEFFTSDMFNVIGEGGGGRHAIVGTLVITGVATAISVPIGLLASIYLVEYGRGRLARSVTTMVDVMTGIPSIVAGLFAAGVLILLYGPGSLSGFGGGLALSVLMIPVVIRACEEMIRLVPNELREASLALGVPKWKTVVKVVLPTAIAGILTSITLAIARVIGETAPLLIVAGLTDSTNANPFEGRMTALPVYGYYSFARGGRNAELSYERSWAASLTLVLIVAFLFFLARILAKALQPKGLR